MTEILFSKANESFFISYFHFFPTKVPIGIFFVSLYGMKNFRFQFQNSLAVSKPVKKELFYSHNPGRLILISSLLVFISFFSLKLALFFQSKNALSLSVQKSFQPTAPPHIYPLLVNLKGQEGPQLAKVYVYITAEDQGKELLKNQRLERKLLFLLSGQSIKNLNREQFHSQIQSQLNAFLSGNLIHKIQIQTEMLN